MWPTWHTVTNMTQCDQHDAMWPTWHNVTNTFQLNDFCVYTCLLMNYSITKAWIVVYISRNSSMSSLSSSVKTTSQQFSCVCLSIIFDIWYSSNLFFGLLHWNMVAALDCIWLLCITACYSSLDNFWFGYFLSPFYFNSFVKLIAFCPWYVIQWFYTWINEIITQ